MGDCLSATMGNVNANETEPAKMTTTTGESATSAATGAASDPNNSNSNDEGIKDYALKKKRPGCTGMFWRSDPTKKTRLSSNSDWPRDGATLRGTAVEHKGKRWLKATEVKQKGGKWKQAPGGAYMPFEYDGHYYLEEV